LIALRRSVLNGVHRPSLSTWNATTQRLSQITTVGSADVVDYLSGTTAAN
jgi:hypothetical protein